MIPILLVLENAIIIGQYVVQLDDESIPTSIVSGADGSVLAEILGIYPLSDIDENRLAAADESCDAAAADVGDRKRRVEEKKVELTGRKRELQEFTGHDGVDYNGAPLSPYGWCGPGTDLGVTPCPNDNDELQYACRRHDHSKLTFRAPIVGSLELTSFTAAFAATVATFNNLECATQTDIWLECNTNEMDQQYSDQTHKVGDIKSTQGLNLRTFSDNLVTFPSNVMWPTADGRKDGTLNSAHNACNGQIWSSHETVLSIPAHGPIPHRNCEADPNNPECVE